MYFPLRNHFNTLYRGLKIITVIIKLSCVIIMRVNPDLASCSENWLEVMQWEAPERGLQGSNWRQNKLHCCGIPPPTHSPCSLTRTYSSHLCWRMCVYRTRVYDRRVSVCMFPTHRLRHSFLSFLSPPHSFSPSHLVLISFFFSLPLTLSHKNMHMHPSIHPHMQLARASPRQAPQFGVGLCKEIQKSVQHHCLMVSPWQQREQGPAMLCQTNTGF